MPASERSLADRVVCAKRLADGLGDERVQRDACGQGLANERVGEPLVARLRIVVAEHVVEQLRSRDPCQRRHAQDPVVRRGRPRRRSADRRGRRAMRSAPVSAPTRAPAEIRDCAGRARRHRRRRAVDRRAVVRRRRRRGRASSIVCTTASHPWSNQPREGGWREANDDDGRVGKLGDDGVAEVAVERADQLVRVEDHQRRPVAEVAERRLDLARERRQVTPVDPHRVEPALRRRRATSRSSALLPIPPGPVDVHHLVRQLTTSTRSNHAQRRPRHDEPCGVTLVDPIPQRVHWRRR